MLARTQFQAMGTTIEVQVPAPGAALAAALVQRLFRQWDRRLTRFRQSSELCALNRSAGRTFFASEMLFRVCAAALAWAARTDGTFDPTLLHQIEQLGYRRTFTDLEASDPAGPLGEEISPGGGWRSVEMDPVRRSIRLPAGTGFDLGGIAKGMAVDAAVQALREAGVEAALVNAGGDLAVHGTPPHGDAWPIAVEGLDREVVPLARGAIATSGTARRRWMQGDAERHHLLDPATGYPAHSDLLAATVVAGTCADADVAATTAFLRGAAGGEAFLRAQGFAGLLVPLEGPPVRVAPWPMREVN